VELQLHIAEGRPLPLAQADVRWQGHAIECRLLAEDADAGFVPDTGRVRLLRAPQGPGVRFDGGVTEGAPVTADFDSMLAKLVTHGATRALAISRARQALADTVMLGVTLNADYLSRVLQHPAFAQGETDTGFLERHRGALKPAPLTDAERRLLLAVAARALHEPADRAPGLPHALMGAWRN
jgi:acetyl/propionyl-CoA carboxylase alpha subunit